MQQQALSVIVAWVRLEEALAGFNAELRQRHGITGLQLAVLRILAERPQLPLAAIRKALVMHPATLGQAIDQLRVKKLCRVLTDPKDRRARLVALTPEGDAVMRDAPVAGPVRLRMIGEDPARLEQLAAALGDAVALFGLESWAGER